MISKRYKSIFIHIPRSGGTSISKLFFQQVKPKFIPKRIYGGYRHLLNYNVQKHDKAIDIKKKVPNHIWKDYFKFVVIRNPFDVMVSSYYWWLQKADKFSEFRERAKPIKKMVFIKFVQKESKRIAGWQGESIDWIVDEKGESMVDFIIRFENFKRDFKKLCRKLNLNFDLPYLNKTIRKDYRNYYNEETKQIIERDFKKTLEVFNYKF